MNNRPKLQIIPTGFDKMLDALGFGILICLWAVILISYYNLPMVIPTHFNLAGKVDHSGSKIILPILASIATIIIIGFTILNKFPHIFNYPVPITNENALKQYTLATKLIRHIKIVMAIIFSWLCISILQISMGKADRLSHLFLPIVLILVFVPIINYHIAARKMR